MTRAYVGLGSNLDGPERQVREALAALAALPGTQLRRRSSLYRSRPLGPPDQPDYINAVAELDTSLDPHALLDRMQSIERVHGRVRAERWGPRTLDLDLLLYGDRAIRDERLTVPHPQIARREFVLAPLLEIEPALEIPGLGSARALLGALGSTGLVRLADDVAEAT